MPTRWFSDRSVRTKVHVAVALVAVVALAVGVQSLLLLRDVDQRMAAVTRTVVPRLEAIGDLRGAQAQLNDAAANQIYGLFSKINEYQSSIAAAVDEQTATTNEMNRSVTDAAGGSSEIAGNIAQAAHAAEQTTAAVAQNREAAASLAAISAEFRELVGRFRF